MSTLSIAIEQALHQALYEAVSDTLPQEADIAQAIRSGVDDAVSRWLEVHGEALLGPECADCNDTLTVPCADSPTGSAGCPQCAGDEPRAIPQYP